MIDGYRVTQPLLRNLLLIITCCFLAGSALAPRFPQVSPLYPLSLCLCTCTGALVFYRKQWLVLLFLALLFFDVGFFHTWQALRPPADPIHIFNLIPQKSLITLRGTIISLVTHDKDRSRFVLQVDAIILRKQQENKGWLPAQGKVQLSIRSPKPIPFSPGNQILAVAMVDQIREYKTPGTFQYVLYMRSHDLYNSGWVNSPEYITRLPRPAEEEMHPTVLVQKLRQQIHCVLRKRGNPVSSGLYQALLIGDRSELTPEIKEQFARTGCFHLLAISGLHIGLLALFLFHCFNWLLQRSEWILLRTHVPSLALVFCFPFLLGYAFIAGMNTPVFRALVMAALLLCAVLLRRQHSMLHLVAAAALFLLTIQPLSLFTVSFQLSFAAMVAIALIYPKFHSIFFQESSRQRPSKQVAFLRWPGIALLVSLSATVGTLPFLLYHFNRFSPIGPIMNLVIEPLLCFIALPLGLLALPLIRLAPDQADFLLYLGEQPLQAANFITHWASELSCATVWTITPTPWEILAYFSLLFFSLIPIQSRFFQKRILISLLFSLLIVHFTVDLYLPKTRPKVRVSFLDIGQGTSTLLELPDGTNMLIDGGGSSSQHFNVGKSIIAPYLWKQRIWNIDAIVISHPDSDHYNGLSFITERFSPQLVYTNGQHSESKSYNQLLRTIKHKSIPEVHPILRDILHKDPLCQLTCIGMPGLAEKSDADNNQSLVLRLDCGQSSFLFPGDIEKKAEYLLLKEKVPLQADVLLAPHHGSKTSISQSFFNTVNPQLVIVSAARNNNKRYPAPENRMQIQQQHIQLLITGENGTITCVTNGNSIETTF